MPSGKNFRVGRTNNQCVLTMYHVILLSLLVARAIEAHNSTHTRSLLMVSDHEIFEKTTELMDTPISVFSTNRTIKGVSINIHTNTWYIIDSTSSVLEFSNNKINILITIERHLLQNIKIDWVNNILYILMATTNLDIINYSVKMLSLKENTLEDLLVFFLSKPLQIEVNPSEGFLFWSTQKGLYRLDLDKKGNNLNIEKTNILILKKEDIGPFLIDYLKSRLLVLLSKDNTIISVSFDGKDVINIRNNTHGAIFNDAITLSYVNELFYWSNGFELMGEDYYTSDQKYYQTIFPSVGFKINLIISKDINQQPRNQSKSLQVKANSTTGSGSGLNAPNHNLWDEYRKSEQPGIIILVLILPFGLMLMLFLVARPIKNCSAKEPLMDLKEIVQRPTFVLTNNPNYQRAMVFKKSDKNELIRIKRNQITITKLLGSGAFGEVFEGNVKDLINGKPEYRVALKSIKEGANEYKLNEFLKEAKFMNKLKHKNILQVLGVCLDNEHIFIIMKLMEKGDLLSFLRKSRMQVFNCINYMRMCIDVAEGCSYLEEMHLVHRDIASRNCLVSSFGPYNQIIKIGDFGLARDMYAHDYYRKDGEALLPVRWMSPESLVDGVYTSKSDVWAFGVLLWEIMSQGQHPYPGMSNTNAMYFVQNGGRLEKPINCPKTLYKLMNKCWYDEPDKRPSFKFCLKFIKSYYIVFEYINPLEEKSIPLYSNL